MRRNILITGGAGFIGSRLVNALTIAESEGTRIWVFDSLHPQVHGINPSFPEFPDTVEFVLGDVTDKDALKSVIYSAQPDVIYHLAAETGTGQSYDEVSRYCHVNVTGTANLVEAIRSEAHHTVKKIVLASSRAVYGEGAYLDADNRRFVGLPRSPEAMAAGDFSVPLPSVARLPGRAAPSDVSLRPAPSSVYASTKLMQEQLLQLAGQESSWSAVALRFQNVYGPGQSLRNPYTGVLSIFARQLLEGGRLEIYEDGKIARDFVFVDDVIDALCKAGRCDLSHGTIVDIGTGEATSIVDVAKLLIANLNCSNDVYFISGQFRVGDIRHACANVSAAAELLDWEAKVKIETGMLRLANWANRTFLSNRMHNGG